MNLLLLTDFSRASENAVRYAVALSNRQLPVEKLILYHSYQVTSLASEIPTASEAPALHLASRTAGALSALKHKVQAKLTTNVQVDSLSDERSVALAVKEISKREKIDLVVIGKRNERKITRLLFENHEDPLIDHCTVPILIVPEKASYQPIQNIVFASDMKNSRDITPISTIRKFLKALKCQLLILDINIEQDHQNHPEIQPEQQALLELLEVSPPVGLLDDHDLVQNVVDFISSNNIQLIITTPKKYRFLDRLIQKSLRRKLSSQLIIPLLIVRKQEGEPTLLPWNSRPESLHKS